MSDPKRLKLYYSDPIGSEDEEEASEDENDHDNSDSEPDDSEEDSSSDDEDINDKIPKFVNNNPIRQPSRPAEDTVDNDDDDDDDDDDSGKEFDSEFANYGVARRLCKIMLRGVEDGEYLGGNIAYSNCYTTAPNPGLTIKPYGILRLPLSKNDIETALQTAKLSLPTDGTLEVPSDLIEIKNPNWKKWVEQELLLEVVKSLGLTEKSDATPVLQGMRVYSGTSAGGVWSSMVWKGNEGFGMLEVVLPGEFCGGEVVMSWNNGAEKVETGGRSEFDTVAAAWYSDVTYSSAPVTEGYKVTLVYQLFTCLSPKPLASRLFASGGIISAVEAIKTADEPVTYALKHQTYSTVDLKMKDFLGSDKAILRHLTQAVKKVGGLSLYWGYIETSYTSCGRDFPDQHRDLDLD
ncbi:hypothetical protein TWF506_008267 [Arthrobotrys conoides]|uniref:Uncharacterized protein n=1 Tax=Arthrobotrys conoides TaxID=74498 RepID=A0AAN8NVL0_9PEZI